MRRCFTERSDALGNKYKYKYKYVHVCVCMYLCIYEIHIRLHKIVVGHEQATGSIGYAILCIFA